MIEQLDLNKEQNKKNKQKGLISIIVPVYNAENYIEKCVKSIINQTYENLEIILVNDGSTDNSGRICDEYAKKDNRIRVIHKKNEGASIARNYGIKQARGEYVGFVDSDDYIENTMYEKLLNSIISNDTDMVICNYSCNNKFGFKQKKITQQEIFELILEKDKFRGYVWNRLYKRKLLGEITFDKNISLCEDLLFNCEYITRCKEISIIDEKLYNYIKRENSAINNFIEKHFSVIKAYQKMEKIYEDYSNENLLKLQMAYLKQCTFLKYYNFIGKYDMKYKKIMNEESKRLIKVVNKSQTNIKTKILLNIYYRFPILIGKIRQVKYKIV